MKNLHLICIVIFAINVTACRKRESPGNQDASGLRLPTAEQQAGLAASLRHNARDMRLTGQVVDESGHPLPKALVHFGLQDTRTLGTPGQAPDHADPVPVKTDANGRFELSAMNAIFIEVQSVTLEGYLPFGEQQLPLWWAPLGQEEPPVHEQRISEPVLLISRAFAGRATGFERHFRLKKGAGRLEIPIAGTQGVALARMGLTLEASASSDPGNKNLILSVDLPGSQIRPLRSLDRVEQFAESTATRLDQSEKPAGSSSHAEPGRLLFLVRTAGSASGVLNVGPGRLNRSGDLEVNLRGWFVPPLARSEVKDPASGPVSTATVHPVRTGTAPPPKTISAGEDAKPSVLIELTDSELIFNAVGGASVETPGTSTPTSRLPLPRKRQSAITIRWTVPGREAQFAAVLPNANDAAETTLLTIPASRDEVLRIEESDDQSFGWIATKTTRGAGGLQVSLPKFPKRFYRITAPAEGRTR